MGVFHRLAMSPEVILAMIRGTISPTIFDAAVDSLCAGITFDLLRPAANTMQHLA
jgi:hypothetical protein